MPTQIVFSLTYNIAFTVVTVINSIIDNTANPNDLQFHIVAPPHETQDFTDYLSETLPQYTEQIHVHGFSPPVQLQQYVKKRYPQRHWPRFMNYARFYFPQTLPNLKKIIYLDTDLVVINDINKLYQDTHLTPKQYYAAVPHTYWAPLYFKNPLKYWKEWNTIKQPFNGGVFVTDLQRWTISDYNKLEHYFKLNSQSKHGIFSLSTEPLQNLLFPDYIQLDRQWNRCGFGNSKWLASLVKVPLNKASVIHWSGGVTKPWTHPNCYYSELWEQYAPNTLQSVGKKANTASA